MSEEPDTLQFSLPSHGDAILSKMNSLREEQHLCDITLLLPGNVGAAEHPSCFRGHKVVLAAASDFLRDQFLLHEGQAELTVSVVNNVEVGKRLLLSCYTGLLEVPRCELVTYLTVASVLQMCPVVEKCAQVISDYIGLTLQNASERPQQTKTLNTEGMSETVDTQDNIFSQNTFVGVKDIDAGCDLTMWEGEAQNSAVTRDCHDIINCAMLNEIKCFRKREQEEHLPLDDEKDQLNKFGKPVMQDEVSVKPDVPKKHFVKSEDAMGSQEPGSYQWQDYDSVFKNIDSYNNHTEGHYIYQCLVCEKSFMQKSALFYHFRTHVSMEPYRCPLCHSTFPNKASLQYHVNLHLNYKSHSVTTAQRK